MAFVGSDKTPAPWGPPGAKKPKPAHWLWRSATESYGNSLRRGRNLAQWWVRWRKTAGFPVVLAFVVFYALLAFMRQPSELVIESSRHAEEMAFLQGVLKAYCAAGGPVLTDRPHGGTELYPRGVLMQGELLAAFNRATTGTLFVTTVNSPEANPCTTFTLFPPLYAGGRYFHFDRKINLAAYRCTMLIRKDTDKSGAILITRVELAR